jgi:hypothetical protein
VGSRIRHFEDWIPITIFGIPLLGHSYPLTPVSAVQALFLDATDQVLSLVTLLNIAVQVKARSG